MRASRLTALVFTTALGLIAPASALAQQSLGITSPTGFPAGGHPTYYEQDGLDPARATPSAITIKLAPGVLAAPSANPSCLKTTQHTSSCQIGTGTVGTSLGLPLSVTAYLAPPPNKADVVGIDVVPATRDAGDPRRRAARSDRRGNVQTVLSLSLTSLGPLASLVTGMSLTVDGTLDGKPFNRMPTNCSPGSSQLTVVYSNKTETRPPPRTSRPRDAAPPLRPKVSGTAHSIKTVAGPWSRR